MSRRKVRYAILGSSTLDSLPALIEGHLGPHGIDATAFVAPYGQYPQMILDPKSALVQAMPEIIFLAVSIEDLGVSRSADDTSDPLEPFIELVRTASEKFRTSLVVVNSFLPMAQRPHFLLQMRDQESLAVVAARGNVQLAATARALPNVTVIDLQQIQAACSPTTWFDPRYYYLARMRFSDAAMEALATSWCRAIKAHLGIRRKCLVLDLDNTLWGGILGEDGADRLQIGQDGIGRAFQDAQRIILAYQKSGTLLAIASKNDHDQAVRVLGDHPDMVLRPQHFAAMRINWDDKAGNISDLATELNIGLDSMVFLDDSAHERQRVRQALPEVLVPEFPTDPSNLPAFLAALDCFDTLRVTDDDTHRTVMYVEDRQRKTLQKDAASLDTFLLDLKTNVTVHVNDSSYIPRIAQLTQKTNQFNLTARRYTDADLHKMSPPQWMICCADVTDRIGNSGTVGAAIVRLDRDSGIGHLDTFLLSCRVLGRGVESAFLATLLDQLFKAGIHQLTAEFIATPRNMPAKAFLPSHGFAQNGDIWTRSLHDRAGLCPKSIQTQIIERAV